MRRAGVIAAVAVVIVGVWYGVGWVGSGISQPVRFPHKTHVEMNLECTSCHEKAEKGVEAGRPSVAVCMTCHAGGDAEGEIKKVQEYGERGVEIPWRRVYALPSHVFFPHRPHVLVARIRCQTCHGAMETLTRPPEAPLRRLAMSDCIECHESWPRSGGEVQKASIRRIATDCATCHR